MESALAAADAVKGGTAIADGLARFHQITTSRRSSFPMAVSPMGWRSQTVVDDVPPARLWQRKLAGLQRARSTVVQIQGASSIRHKTGGVRYVRA